MSIVSLDLLDYWVTVSHSLVFVRIDLKFGFMGRPRLCSLDH